MKNKIAGKLEKPQLKMKNWLKKIIFWELGRGLAIPGLKHTVWENVFEINNDFSNLIFEPFLFYQFIKFFKFSI
jgi:hypothetical protein